MNRIIHIPPSLIINQILLTAFTLILSIPHHTAQSVPTPCVHMDLVMVLHDTAQTNMNYEEDFGYAAAYRGMIESFAKVFALTEDKTRVSVVGLDKANQYGVLLSLTPDVASWTSTLTRISTFDKTKIPSIQDGLKTVRENVFNDQSAPSKARVILVSTFTDGHQERFGTSLKEEVKGLNDMENMLVLVVTRENSDKDHQEFIREKMHEAFTEDLVLLASREDNNFIRELSENLPAWIMEKVNKKLCKTTTSPPTPQPTDPPEPQPTDPPMPKPTDPKPQPTDPKPQPTDPPKPQQTDPPKPSDTSKSSNPTKPTDPPAPTTEDDWGDDDRAESIRANGVFLMLMTMIALRLLI